MTTEERNPQEHTAEVVMDQRRDRTLTEPLSASFEREHREIDDGILTGVDGAADPSRRAALVDAVCALRRHIYAEEELMFPALRDAGLAGPVLVMLREHAQMWQLLDTIDQLITADGPAEELHDACHGLLDLLARHNPKEEVILYPQVDTLLDLRAASVLRRLLLEGEPPAGWRCQQLR